jgi:dTDP-4-amino-4,6-dideoxygalactose transaminase
MNVNVTQPFLPPLEEFEPYLKQIWENKLLTNNGPFHQQFERELAEYLGVPYISVFANATLALLTALQTLDIKGEVITTPFSFVATTHALKWNGITPVFTDIEPVFGNMDPDKIEAAITPKTSAIMPVHVYGNPCDDNRIKAIASKHNLKLIYDAAHCFGVKQSNKSILNYGDLSVVSFHATKVFNTFEGGAIISHSKEIKQRIDDLKNFGFRNEVTVIAPGINAKMNELQAAFGLLQLKYIDEVIEKRKTITHYYRERLQGIRGIRILEDIKGVTHNYSYFPIFISSEFPISRDELYNEFKKNEIFVRRYFYPLISNFSMYNTLESANQLNLKVANQLAEDVLCLPIYPEMDTTILDEIIAILYNVSANTFNVEKTYGN